MIIKALYFDMDDTLHSFSRCAGAAMNEVYSHIVQKHCLSLENLKQKYAKIMAQTEKDAFFDGRTSTEYRTERFTKKAFFINDFICILLAGKLRLFVYDFKTVAKNDS